MGERGWNLLVQLSSAWAKTAESGRPSDRAGVA
eukprot:SAG22_NODE_2305_length_2736_cov_1.701934_2_plen_33_part_00